MGDVMLIGVLNMPYDMAMKSEIGRLQYHSRGKEAAARILADEAEIARLQAELSEAKESLRLAVKSADLADAAIATARADALEEAAELARDSYSKEWAELRFIAAHNDALEAAAMVQVLRINEGGQRYMSGLSPEARAAIRALKITTREQPK